MRTAALVATAVSLALVTASSSWTGSVSRDFWFWLAACTLADCLWVRLPLGRATTSMASCCNFAALLVLDRGEAMAVVALSVCATEALWVRKPPSRVAFNAAQAALATWTAALTLQASAGSEGGLVSRVDHAYFLPICLAAIVYTAVNTLAVSWAVALHEGVSVGVAWRINFGAGYELLSSGALLSLGALIAIHYDAAGPWATVFIALPLLLAYEGYRRFMSQGSSMPASDQEESRAA